MSRRRLENRGSRRKTGDSPPRGGRSSQRNIRTPRLSNTPPSVNDCRPNSPPLAPTSAPVSSSGGKNPGKADEAVTAIATVASPTWIRSMRSACPGCRCIIIRPFRLKEHRHPSLRLVARMCSSGRCRQLEQTGVSIEILLVVVFQQPRSRQFAIRESQKPALPAQGEAQGKATGNPIADIEAHESEELGSSRLELVGGAVVAVPVEHQVGSDDTATGHRGDVGHSRQNPRVAEKADQAQVIETRPEAATGEGESKSVHDGAPAIVE